MFFKVFSIFLLNVILQIDSYVPKFPTHNFNSNKLNALTDKIVNNNEQIHIKSFKLGSLGPLDEFNNRLLCEVSSPEISISILQKASGAIPRSYMPSIMHIKHTNDQNVQISIIHSMVEEAIRWYVDNGGRLQRLNVYPSSKIISSLPLTPHDNHYVFNNENLIAHCNDRIIKKIGESATLHNIIGRLLHEKKDFRAAIKAYTSSLEINQKSATTFRNLGSAYHASGDMQLAFASYQQAIQLEPKDASVYLKLAYFYEDLSLKEWDDAGTYSQQCYQYYLDNIDPEDTDVLTRLGNLLIREHKPEPAAEAFKKALKVDPTLHNIWFNLAHAQVNMRDSKSAKESLTRALDLRGDIPAAKHMLKALTDEEAKSVKYADHDYIRDLYNSYADSYDEHGKKLRYATPRVIREEMAVIYKSINRFAGTELGVEADAEDGHSCAPSTMGSSEGGCSSHTHVTLTAGPLEVLDLGCGTGLAGGWLKDYCKTLVGVDLSEEMVKIARKKQLYQELNVMSIQDYMHKNNERKFDLVVAADVLSYIGDLADTIKLVPNMLKSGTHFAFTVEALPTGIDSSSGFRLLTNGRFGYTKSYIDNLIEKNNFDVVVARDFSPRMDFGEPVPGYLYIIAKK